MHAKFKIEAMTMRLEQALAARVGTTVLVSNELGLGIVPDNAMAQQFRDHAGRVNQAFAAAPQTVFFVAAGLPLQLKPGGANQ